VPQPLLLLAVVASGALLGVQARVNGELGDRLHSALDAAGVSFLGGTLVLLLLVAGAASRRAAVARLRRMPTRWWWWLGGVGGAAVVTATAQGVPQIGVALVSVCVVAGTAAGGLLADQFGLGPGGRESATGWRMAGALLAVAAVTLGAAGDRHADVRPLLLVALFGAGVASVIQPAAAGRIRAAATDATVAALVSFAVATVLLGLAVVATGQVVHRHWPGSWWLYTGGLAGAVYVGLVAAAVGRLGVLTVSLATVAGQLVAAVGLDVVWPAPGTSLRAATVVGATLTLVAVGVTAGGAQWPGWRRRDGS
jgi:bacterial/archaeal transporter family-2 protein